MSMSRVDQKSGVVVSYCVDCGGTSTFEWKANNNEYGSILTTYNGGYVNYQLQCYRLFRCAGRGRGGFGVIVYSNSGASGDYPGSSSMLISFTPTAMKSLAFPETVPDGIANEFREAEKCLASECYRAAAGLFRSVLDKTMRANGYKTKKENNLYTQIEAAADEGVITASRKRRAHDDVRVLGNDVLHDDWRPITENEVSLTHHYCQRILEDFYDDRPTVESILIGKGRMTTEVDSESSDVE